MNLIFRIHNYNKVSIGALIGSCDKDFFKQFNLLLWESSNPFPKDALAQGRTLLIYSFMMPHLEQIQNELDLLRTQNTNFEFMAGGAQASASPDSVAQIGFDYVFSGEAENYFQQILDNWKNNQLAKGIKKFEKAATNLDLYSGYSEIVGYLPPIEISRGCNFGCMYCGVPKYTGGKLRHRSLNKVLKIVNQYTAIKPKRRIKFLAPNAFAYGSDGKEPNIDTVDELVSKILETDKIKEVHLGSFPSEVRPDFVTHKLLKAIAHKLSNKTIVMGVQSGSDRILKQMNRGHDKDQAVKAISLLREFGFKPHIDFIIGNPGETDEDQFQLLDFMKMLINKYQIRVHMHAFMPLPGTPWENKSPTEILPEIRTELRKLTSQGHLDGWWENQVGFGRHKQTKKH